MGEEPVNEVTEKCLVWWLVCSKFLIKCVRLEGEGGGEMLWVLLLSVGTCCFFFNEFVCVCVCVCVCV